MSARAAENVAAMLERAALQSPDAPYLVDDARAWSYAEVVSIAARVSGALRDAGLVTGARVLLAMRDRVEAVATLWGVWSAGMVAVPVPPSWSRDEFRRALEMCDASLVVADRSSADRLVPLLDHGRVALWGVDAVGGRAWDAAIDSARPGTTTPVGGRDVALWLFTSGSTGAPKALLHAHASLAHAARASAAAMGLVAGDRVLSTAKLFFAYGLGNSVYVPAAVGASAVLLSGPSATPLVVGCAERASVTVLCAVPAALRGLANDDEASLPASVRLVLSAGETLRDDVAAAFLARFGRAPREAFGCTEALHHVTCAHASSPQGSVGRPVAGFELSIRDVDGAVIDGREGDLWIRGPTLAVATREGAIERPIIDAEGWWKTGDRAVLDGGTLLLRGRNDDMMKVNGYRVHPEEIERALCEHEDVTEAAVIARDDGDAHIAAFVVLARPLADLDATLGAHCAQRLARYKIPDSFTAMSDLPRTGNGKLRRATLRDAR